MKFRGWFEDKDNLMRNIFLSLYGTTERFRELDELERCYDGDLFQGAAYEWIQDWDALNQRIPNENKKPIFKAQIAREIVDTLSASIFGYSNFPEISITTKKDIYPNRDLIKEAIEDGRLDEDDICDMSKSELKKLKINLCNDELKKLCDLFSEENLMMPVMVSTKKGLAMGKSILTYRFVEGEVVYETINYKHVEKSIKYHDDIPDKIISFSETYIYEDVDKDDPTRFAKYHYKRTFNEEEIILYHPAKFDGNEVPKFTVKKRSPHGFQFCPAVVMATDTYRSVYDGQVENIKAYVYLQNDLIVGLSKNMNPQYAALEEDTQNYTVNRDNGVLRRGALWKIKARDIKALAFNSGGYEEAGKQLKELRKQILDAAKCRILNVEMDSEESGVALSLKMSPDASAIGLYRISFGTNGLAKIIKMVYESAKIFLKRDKKHLNDLVDFDFPEIDNFRIKLNWGDLTPPTEDKIMKSITNSLTAYKGGIMDLDHAVKRISKYFDVMDVEDLIRVLQKAEDDLGDFGEDAKQLFGRLKKEAGESNHERLKEAEKISKDEKPEKENVSKYLQENK